VGKGITTPVIQPKRSPIQKKKKSPAHNNTKMIVIRRNTNPERLALTDE
jgi:hypothetical protein